MKNGDTATKMAQPVKLTESEQFARRAAVARDRARMDPIHRDYFEAKAATFERWALATEKES